MNREKVFEALSHPVRQLILDECSKRQSMTLYECMTQLIMTHDVAISRQAVSKHLTVLEEADLIRSKKEGKYKVLYFHPKPLQGLLDRWLESPKNSEETEKE
jgi:DNA-binding transcriptional ArsR family regulator